MEYLQSFSLHDFLIFSPDSFFKLFELANQTLWPTQIASACLVAIAIFLLYKRHPYTQKFILVWLGLVWCFVAYSYFAKYYRQIFIYAHHISYFYYAQACLLFLFALLPSDNAETIITKRRIVLGSGFILYGLCIHPMVSALIWNQKLIGIEVFSIAPDPTAIATIGFILLLPIKGYFLLMVIPLTWLLFSLVTFQAF